MDLSCRWKEGHDAWDVTKILASVPRKTPRARELNVMTSSIIPNPSANYGSADANWFIEHIIPKDSMLGITAANSNPIPVECVNTVSETFPHFVLEPSIEQNEKKESMSTK